MATTGDDRRMLEGDHVVSVQHPVVGSWRVTVTVPGTGPGAVNLALFSSDGTVLVAVPSPTPAAPGANHRLDYWTPAIGSWAASSDGGATMTFVALGVDENGASAGTHTITATVQTDTDGWHGPFTIEIASPDGKTLASVSGTVSATRIAAAENRSAR